MLYVISTNKQAYVFINTSKLDRDNHNFQPILLSMAFKKAWKKNDYIQLKDMYKTGYENL